MKPLKIAAIILVISGGLAGSYFILKSSVPKAEGDKTNEIAPASLNSVTKNPIEWLEQTAGIGNSPAEDSVPSDSNFNQASASQNSASSSSLNLTEFVAGSIFNQMKKFDQSGSGPFKNFDPKDPQSQKAVADAIAKLQDPASILNQVVNDSEIKISSDNSASSKGAYLQLTGEIIIKNSNEAYSNPSKAVNDAFNSSDVSAVLTLADTYEIIYQGFLNTSVPSDWLDLHRRYLILLKKVEATYRGIADFQNDPVKSALLSQVAPNLAKEELKLKQEYYKKVLGLNS